MPTPPIRSRWAGLAIATAVALAAGLLASLVAPRGPVTTGQVLVLMLLALLTGLAGGLAGRTRWALLPMLVASIVGVELGRLDVDAASPALRFDTPYGTIAFLITRGLHGLLVLLPMTLGLLAGIGLARRLGWMARPAKRHLPIGSVLLALLTLGLAVLVVLPPSTPPVLDANGQPVPGSLAELTTVELGGRDHAVMLRAADPDTPVLLYLAGGPGQSDLALSRALTTGWLEDKERIPFAAAAHAVAFEQADAVQALLTETIIPATYDGHG